MEEWQMVSILWWHLSLYLLQKYFSTGLWQYHKHWPLKIDNGLSEKKLLRWRFFLRMTISLITPCKYTLLIKDHFWGYCRIVFKKTLPKLSHCWWKTKNSLKIYMQDTSSNNSRKKKPAPQLTKASVAFWIVCLGS